MRFEELPNFRSITPNLLALAAPKAGRQTPLTVYENKEVMKMAGYQRHSAQEAPSIVKVSICVVDFGELINS